MDGSHLMSAQDLEALFKHRVYNCISIIIYISCILLYDCSTELVDALSGSHFMMKALPPCWPQSLVRQKPGAQSRARLQAPTCSRREPGVGGSIHSEKKIPKSVFVATYCRKITGNGFMFI